jgi:hypothetical protein
VNIFLQNCPGSYLLVYKFISHRSSYIMAFQSILQCMKYEVLTAVNMSLLVFRVVTPCGLAGRYQHFGGTYCPHLQSWKWRQCFSEMLVSAYTAFQPRRPSTYSSVIYKFCYAYNINLLVSKFGNPWYRIVLNGLNGICRGLNSHSQVYSIQNFVYEVIRSIPQKYETWRGNIVQDSLLPSQCKQRCHHEKYTVPARRMVGSVITQATSLLAYLSWFTINNYYNINCIYRFRAWWKITITNKWLVLYNLNLSWQLNSIKSSRAHSRVSWLQVETDVSGTLSPIIRVVMWLYTPSVVMWLGVSSCFTTLMMVTEIVPETSVSTWNQLMQLCAREDFIECILRA